MSYVGGCPRDNVNLSTQDNILYVDPYDFVYSGIRMEHRILKEQNNCIHCGAKTVKI